MAVSPDLLLNIKAPATAAKAPNAPPKPATQPSRDEASSFANVYARERQAKPTERSEPAAKPSRDKPVNEKPSQETAKADGSEKPVAAKAGKDLPADEVAVTDKPEESDEASDLDPLLLLGLGTQPDPATDPLTGQLPAGSEFLVAQAQTPAATDEVEDLPEDSLLGQRTLGQQPTVAEKTLADQQSTKTGNTAQVAEPIAAALKASVSSGDESKEPSLDEDFSALLDQLSSKDSQSAAPDTSANRLNPLTQAINQQVQQPLQNQQIQRPTLVPGQPVPMQPAGFSEAVVDRVMWMSSQNLKSAEIQMDPAELGRMEVRIEMNKEQAQVTFLSPHAAVRDTLESQMHRLRDMFSQQGMTMDVNVSDQSLARGWQGQDGGESRGGGGRDRTAVAEEDVAVGSVEISSNRASSGRGLVDYYA